MMELVTILCMYPFQIRTSTPEAQQATEVAVQYGDIVCV